MTIDERRLFPPVPLHPCVPAQVESVYAVIEDVIRETSSQPVFVAALRQRACPPDGPHWLHLPILCCQAAGGNPEQGIVVAAAFELARLAANVLDDVEDADGDDALWQSLGIPQAINVGTGLIFASLMALSRLREHGVTLRALAAIQTEFARTGFRMGEGQHLDLCGGPSTGPSTGSGGTSGTAEERRSGGAEEQRGKSAIRNPQSEIEKYWQIAAAKSGAFFELGCRAGALLGDLTPEDIAPYAEYGWHLGLLIQIANDLAGVLDEDGSSDLIRRKPTLPVIYAFSVAPETQTEHLRRAWTAAAHDAQARREVRRLVIELGAPQYIIVEAERHYRRARQALWNISSRSRLHKTSYSTGQALEQTDGQPDLSACSAQAGALDQLAEMLNLHRPASFLSNADANLVSSKGTSRC